MIRSATRDRLVEAATACLRDEGLAGTSSRSITAAAEVNLAAITYHFGSKDDLVAEALLRTIRRALEPPLAALRRDDLDAPSRVLLALASLREGLAGASAEAPAYVEALVQARHLPALHAGILELAGELRRFLSDQIADQRAAGDLPSWIQPDAMATLLIATVNGIVLQAVLDPDGTDVDALARQLAGLLLAARTRA
jgi:AcrR family transcriptional regulator